ncbi:MAG: hypothetical protein ACM3JQ_04800 [Candidatus Eiseniibacteriota bacterium]
MKPEDAILKKVSIAASFFVCTLLLSAFAVTSVFAGAHYDAGEKLKGFTYNHKKVSESKAKKACSSVDKSDKCVECVDHRANLQGLKGYEVVKCLKEPTKYNY